jgi:hypothetical protein
VPRWGAQKRRERHRRNSVDCTAAAAAAGRDKAVRAARGVGALCRSGFPQRLGSEPGGSFSATVATASASATIATASATIASATVAGASASATAGSRACQNSAHMVRRVPRGPVCINHLPSIEPKQSYPRRLYKNKHQSINNNNNNNKKKLKHTYNIYVIMSGEDSGKMKPGSRESKKKKRESRRKKEKLHCVTKQREKKKNEDI